MPGRNSPCARAEREQGPRFDVRAFHDLVLGSGSVPLTAPEQEVREWISARKRRGRDSGMARGQWHQGINVGML